MFAALDWGYPNFFRARSPPRSSYGTWLMHEGDIWQTTVWISHSHVHTVVCQKSLLACRLRVLLVTNRVLASFFLSLVLKTQQLNHSRPKKFSQISRPLMMTDQVERLLSVCIWIQDSHYFECVNEHTEAQFHESIAFKWTSVKCPSWPIRSVL